jgi:methionyl-tRNA formyltransferase
MELRVVFMATPDFAVPALHLLIRNSYQIVAVYTQPDKPAGRSLQPVPPPVKRLAMDHSIPVVQPETLEASSAFEELASCSPDLIVVAAYGRILPSRMLSLPKFGCVNLHPSLLPRHRGSSPIANTILCGDEVTGVTVMLVDAGMDSGPILAQREVFVSPQDTSGSLTPKLAWIGAELLLESLPLWIGGKIRPRPQDESQATFSRMLTKEDGEIDWKLPAVQLWRRIRAFDPWPGCYAWWKGRRLKVCEALPLAGAGEVGKVVAITEPAPAAVGVGTGVGVLGLLRVQLEGRREISAADFVRGQRDFVGSVLA